MAERLKTMMEDLVKVEREIWSASHQRTLRDLQSNLLRERGEILEELSPAGSGLLRRLASRSVHGARSVADVELRAQLALIEASLEEVDRKLGPKEGTGATEGDLTELLERQKDLSGGIELLEGFISDISTHVLSRARIVGATSAKTALMLAQLGQFDAVLIDEASMMPMVMSYLAAGLARERVVVAGDFRQLPPISKDQSERGRSLYARSVFESSSITKGISTGLHLPHVSILTSHFRAHPAIMGLFNERFYGGRLQSAYVDPSPPAIESDKSCEELLAQRVAVVDTSSLEPQGIYTHGSKANPVHAVIIRTLVQRLLRGSSLNAADVGVIAPYRPQVDLVHSLLREAELSDVACGTVHRFQGDERRVIVLDLVESGPHRLGAFLSGTEVGELSGRLLNVALSRAREQLFIVSNNEHLLSQLRSDSLVRGIVAQCVQAGHLLQAEDIALHGEEGAWGGGSSAMQLFAHEEFYAALVADLIEAQLEVQLSSPLLSTLGASVVAGALARGVASRGVKARVVVAHGGSQEAINAMQAAGIEVAVVKGDVGEFSAVGVVIDGEVAWLAPRSPLAADQTGVRCGVRVVSPSLARLVKPLTARLLQRAPVGDTPSRLLTHRGTAVDAIKHETLSPVAR
jgi:hypothetical protein